MNVLESRRWGRFCLGAREMRHSTDGVRALMSTMLVTRCEFDYAQDAFVYTAASDAFDVVPAEDMIPWYMVYARRVVAQDGSMQTTFELHRQKRGAHERVAERSDADDEG